MTEDQVVAAVAEQLQKFDGPTEARIKKAIPMGVAIFANEYEWEFMSKYVSGVATAVGSTTGKTYLVVDDDLFKPIVVFDSNNADIPYIDRKAWARTQTGTPSDSRPYSYTVIGRNLYLTAPSSGNTVNIIYTLKSDNVDLGTVPTNYHPTVVMAVVMWMTPSILTDSNGNDVPNPAFGVAEKRYNRFVSKALGMDLSHKGRVLKMTPNKTMLMAARYNR